MEKVLYFNTGDSENAFRESLAYPASSFRGFSCIDATSLGMYFLPILSPTNGDQNDLIDLTITTGKHQDVITVIQKEISSGTSTYVTIADDDNSKYLHEFITACSAPADSSDGSSLQVNKISGSTQVELIDISTRTRRIKTMTLANIHASDAASVELFLANATDNYYIFKGLSIPAGSTLVLDSDDLHYDFTTYNLYVKLGAAGSTVDVTIKS